jgi:hypothetical protein
MHSCSILQQASPWLTHEVHPYYFQGKPLHHCASRQQESCAGTGQPLSRRLLLYDGLSARFSTVQLRAKQPNCFACGCSQLHPGCAVHEDQSGNSHQTCPSQAHEGSISAWGKQTVGEDTRVVPSLQAASSTHTEHGNVGNAAHPLSELAGSGGTAGFDYAAFAGVQSLEEVAQPVRLLTEEQRMTCKGLKERLAAGQGREVVLLDVRPRALYDVAHMQGAIHAPVDLVSIHNLGIDCMLTSSADVCLQIQGRL